jgi:hypothetical protein
VAAVPALLADASVPGCGWMPAARTVQPDGVCVEQSDAQSSASKINQSIITAVWAHISSARNSTCEIILRTMHARCIKCNTYRASEVGITSSPISTAVQAVQLLPGREKAGYSHFAHSTPLRTLPSIPA